jgi:hypothetical protein
MHAFMALDNLPFKEGATREMVRQGAQRVCVVCLSSAVACVFVSAGDDDAGQNYIDDCFC